MSEAMSRVGELALVLCLIFGLGLLPSFAAWPSYLHTSLSVYYSMSETSGTAITDSLGANNGTIDGATVNQTGKVGVAYKYDGTDDYSYIPKTTSALNFTDNFTISYWLNWTSEDIGYINSIQYGAPNRGWMFYGSSGKVNFKAYGFITDDDPLLTSTTTLNSANWYHILVVYNGTRLALFINGVAEHNIAETGTLTNSAKDLWLMRYHLGNTSYMQGKIDELAIWNRALNSTEIANLYNSGNGITYETPPATYSVESLNYPVANQVPAVLNVTNAPSATNVYWNFGDTSSGYSTTTNTTHNFTSSGYFNVTANVTIGGTNHSVNSLNLTVYAPLTAIVVTPSSYVPFLATSQIVNLSFSSTGGTAWRNTSWTFTLTNGTTETVTVENRSYYEKTVQSGIYQVSATVCDKTFVTCATNTTTFNAWNITGGVFVVNSFNKTSNLLAEIFEGDNLTFTSTSTSVAWNLSGYTASGTSVTFVFNETPAYWKNQNYLHFNVSVTNTWGSYVGSTYFTVIGARYNITTSACANQSLYCFLVMNMYNELTTAQLTTNVSWSGYFETSGAHGHEKSVFINTNASTLNISYCINATPLEALTVNGQVIYSATNYAERTYSFLDAEFPICTTCTTTLGNVIEAYTRTNTSVSIITFNVLDGGSATPNALVKIQGNFNATDSWKTIASQVSDESGQVQFYLAYCPTYYKIIVELDGAVVYTEKTCIKDSVVNLNIDSSLPEVFDMLGLVSTTCSWLNTTEVISCLVSDPTGRTVLASLNVYPAWTTTATCTTSEASTSTTLYCDMSAATDGDYSWLLELTTSEGTYPMSVGHFTIGTEESFSGDGTLLMVVFLLLLFLGARVSPIIMIVMGTVGVIFLGALGLFHITGGFIAWLIVLAVVAIGGMI